MKLKELRKKRNLTQKELASMSGVNFRSLQDYEQGHKKLTSASGDVLLRLSTVLGCSMEDLLLDDFFPNTAPLSFPLAENETSGFFCEKFKQADAGFALTRQPPSCFIMKANNIRYHLTQYSVRKISVG